MQHSHEKQPVIGELYYVMFSTETLQNDCRCVTSLHVSIGVDCLQKWVSICQNRCRRTNKLKLQSSRVYNIFTFIMNEHAMFRAVTRFSLMNARYGIFSQKLCTWHSSWSVNTHEAIWIINALSHFPAWVSLSIDISLWMQKSRIMQSACKKKTRVIFGKIVGQFSR